MNYLYSNKFFYGQTLSISQIEEARKNHDPNKGFRNVISPKRGVDRYYKFEQLIAPEIPSDVDPLNKPDWLSPTDFKQVFGLEKAAYFKELRFISISLTEKVYFCN